MKKKITHYSLNTKFIKKWPKNLHKFNVLYIKEYFLMFGSLSFSWLRCLDIKAFTATKRVKCVSDKTQVLRKYQLICSIHI